MELISGDLTTVYKEQTALAMYREMVYQIYVHAVDFKSDGVREREMMDELRNIESILKSEFAQDEFESTKTEIFDNIEEAEIQVNAAFSSAGTGGETDAE